MKRQKSDSSGGCHRVSAVTPLPAKFAIVRRACQVLASLVRAALQVKGYDLNEDERIDREEFQHMYEQLMKA